MDGAVRFADWGALRAFPCQVTTVLRVQNPFISLVRWSAIRNFQEQFEGRPKNIMDNRQAHILIVDDSVDDRNVYSYYLASKGYRVTKAHDGKEALERAFGLYRISLCLTFGCRKSVAGR